MKHKYLFMILSQLCMLHIAHASTTQSIPSGLMYSNKPIDSLCFMSDKNKSEIDLKKCGANKKTFTVKAMNQDLSKQGYLGYDYEDKSYTPALHGYSYYKYYPVSENKYWVYTINNSGGTGQFTAVYSVERKNQNTLILEGIASGDRCLGGIQDVSEKSGNLIYSVNLTAFDLIASVDKNTKLKAFDDLAACAVCCTAKSFYTVDKNTKSKLEYVELNKVSDVSEMPEQGVIEACFNKLYVSYIKEKSVKLTPEQLNSFVNEFKQTCVK
jgi:hypothetical protein